MPAQLVSLSEGPNILLDKPILLLGRHPECDIQLNSRKVSRRHCCVAQATDHLIVRDLGSTNGIRINGSRVLEGTLKSGDELTVGNFRYHVTLEDAQGAVPPPLPVKVVVKSASKPIAVPAGPPMIPVAIHVGPPPLPLQAAAKLNDSDDYLEDAEEPVELDESTPPGRVLAAKPVAAPARPPQAPSSGPLPVSQSGVKKDSGSILIPDHLSLIPQSGAYPKPPEGGMR